ncbi:MAG: hypothetical protein R3E98_08240 [Gemmatimonadota bacterium]
MNRLPKALSLALVGLSACVTTNAVMLDPLASYPPVPEAEIVVYVDEADVEAEFVKIALIYAEGDADLHDQSQFVEAMRKKAAEIGAHAIILEDFEEPSTGARVAEAILGTSAERRARVLAIRFVSPR